MSRTCHVKKLPGLDFDMIVLQRQLETTAIVDVFCIYVTGLLLIYDFKR